MINVGEQTIQKIYLGDEIVPTAYQGNEKIWENNSIYLSSKAGTFAVSTSGFVNPKWEYNGEIQNTNDCNFTIINDNDKVKFSWDSYSNSQIKIANTATRKLLNFDLSDLRAQFLYYVFLTECVNVTGDLKDLGGKITYFLELNRCDITGDLKDLGGLLKSLSLSNCTKITGDLSDLNGNITETLSLTNCSNITGDLSDLGGNMKFWLSLTGCPKITGDLSVLGGKISSTINLNNCTNVYGVYTPTTTVPTTMRLDNTNLSVSDVDSTLNNISSTTKTNGTFSGAGLQRSSASDSAVEKLVSQGWTISGLTKVVA